MIDHVNSLSVDNFSISKGRAIRGRHQKLFLGISWLLICLCLKWKQGVTYGEDPGRPHGIFPLQAECICFLLRLLQTLWNTSEFSCHLSHFVFCDMLWVSIKAYRFNSDPVIPTSTFLAGGVGGWGAVWLAVSTHINTTTSCLFFSQRVYFLLRTSILKKP